MSPIGAEYFIELDDVLISTELLGRQLKVDRRTYKFILEVPESPDLTFDRMSLAGGDAPPDVAFVQSDRSTFVTLKVVRIVINIEADLAVATYDPTRDRAMANAVFFTCWNYAESAAREFTDFVRVQGRQPWIEPTGKHPRVLNLVRLYDLTKPGDPSAFGFSIGKAPGTIRVVGDDQILSTTEFEAIGESMQTTGPLGVGELLVGEARYLLWSEQTAGSERAMLIAAAGVEVQTKYVLRKIAQPDQQSRLEQHLRSGRRRPNVHGLFLKSLPELAGRHLGDAHKDLARRIQNLLTARNGVAHDGDSIAKAEAHEHVQTAEDAIAFLRTISTQPPRPTGPVSISQRSAGEPNPVGNWGGVGDQAHE